MPSARTSYVNSSAVTGCELFTQNSPGVPGTAETFDQFGGLEIVF